MWWLILAFILILLLEFFVFVILYGIRLTLRVDANNMSICIKCYVLDYFEVMCVKLFVCENKFYYQINKKALKVINANDNDEKSKKNKKKLRKSAFFSNLWSKRPEITIKNLTVNYGANFEEAKNRAIFDGAITIISNTLMATNSNKLKINDFQLKNVSEESKFNGIDASCEIGGLTILKILFYALYAISIKGKYQVKI